MTLKAIGTGFGRTGTESLKTALEILGFGPCNHMKVILSNPAEEAKWRTIVAEDTPPDWEQALAGYNSAVDFPAVYYWRDLFDHYPDAKFVHSIRSSESWLNSMENSMLPVLRNLPDKNSIGHRLMAEKVFGGKLDDPEHLIKTYEDHNALVQKTIPAGKLLVLELGAGWEPLCNFLNVPVPDQPYPSGNTADEFQDFFDKRAAEKN